MQRQAYAIYADDIRYEVGNKRSIIGIYSSHLYAHEFPLVLAKLCVSVSISTPSNQPFETLKVSLLKDQDILTEGVIPLEELAKQKDLDQMEGTAFTMNIDHVLSPFAVQEPCVLRVRIKTEKEELKAPGLQISFAPKEGQ